MNFEFIWKKIKQCFKYNAAKQLRTAAPIATFSFELILSNQEYQYFYWKHERIYKQQSLQTV